MRVRRLVLVTRYEKSASSDIGLLPHESEEKEPESYPVAWP